MNNQATYCHDCGIFIQNEPLGFSGQCDDCHEDELIRAVEENVWPEVYQIKKLTAVTVSPSIPVEE